MNNAEHQPPQSTKQGPPPARAGARLRSAAALLVLLCLALFWTGCKVTEQNYKTLSFWFDGVPDPNAALDSAGVPIRNATNAGVPKKALTVHKPYEEKKCAECHDMAGQVPQFALAVSSCLKCHEKVPNQYPEMHGPVAMGACLWCHEPHDSSFPSLLRTDGAQLCTQCHDRGLLSDGCEGHQSTSQKNCMECHVSHGGNDRRLLRPAGSPGLPTRPASLPVAGG